MRHVFETLGTVASLDVPSEFSDDVPAIESSFREFDERFSLYRPDSELSRIASGHLSLAEASASLRSSYARSLDWREATSGWFTPHRPDGVLDLNGIVKAEAIERAGRLLDGSGCPAWSVNVGGDILVRADAEPWVTGIADPRAQAEILCSMSLGDRRRAIATSGSAQRGDHIWRGGMSGPPAFVQVSVIADDIVTADVLATAIVAGGRDALDDFSERWDVDILAVDRQGGLLATPGVRQLLPSLRRHAV